MSKVAQAALNVIKPFADQLGFYLVEVSYEKKFDGYHLTVVIDKSEGISINDCEALSRAIDAPLDEADPTNGEPYHLDISSMGLDRPLSTQYDYDKYNGKEVIVKLYAPLNGVKEYKGVLRNYDDTTLTIETDKSRITFEKKLTAKVVPYIKF